MIAKLRRLLTNPAITSSAGMIVIRVANLSLGLVITVTLTRLLGVEGYGAYAFAFALASVLGLAVQLGVPTLVVRESARAQDVQGDSTLGRKVAVVSWGLMVLALAGVLLTTSAAALTALGVRLTESSPALLVLSAGLAVMLGFIALASAAIHGDTRPLVSALPDGIVRPVLFLLAILSLAAISMADPVSVMAVHIGAALLAAAFGWALSASSLVRIRRSSSAEARRWTHRAWLKSVVPLSLSMGLSVLNQRFDILMVGFLLGPAQVALYAVAAQVASLATAGQTIVNAQAAPRLAAAIPAGVPGAAQRIISLAVLATAALSICTFLAVLVMGEWALRTVFGIDFTPAYPILAILLAGQMVSSLMGPTALTLNMGRLEQLTLRASFAALALNVTLNVPMVLLLGAEGAALATFVSTALAQFIMMRSVKMRLGLVTHAAGAACAARSGDLTIVAAPTSDRNAASS